LLGGQIDGLFGDASILAPHVQAGTIVVLGVAAARRSPALPDLPTMGEAGFAGVEAEGWHGLGVSSRTPAAIVARLRDAVTAAQEDPAFVDGLARQGATAGDPGPASLAALVRNDTRKWGAIVASAKVTIE
jgi:tripartite-type tricarboxylate transporter receptor subunit TctC